jgi:ATP-binding cassette subfamily B multidrug efflux pump
MTSKEKKYCKFLEPGVISKLFLFVKPYQGVFYLLLLAALATGLLAPTRPYLVQLTIDRYFTHADYAGIIRMTTWMLALLLIQSFIQYFLTYFSDWLGQHVVRDLRVKLYAHTTQLSVTFYNKTPTGRLVTRTISDTELLADIFSQGLAALLADILQLIAMVVFMVYMDWRLTLLSLATLPLLVMATYLFKEKIKVVYKQVRDAVSKLNAFVQTHVTSMSIIQIYNREKLELAKFMELNEAHKQANNKSVLYYSLYMPSLEIMRAIGISLLVWYGARGVTQGYVSLGTLTAFLMYLKMFFRPLYHLAERFNTLQMGMVSAERIIKLLENQEKVVNKGIYRPKRLQGEVVFQDVWFGYEEGNYVLKHVNFHIPAQQSLAIVGATGAGKSTIINLLARFHDPQQGLITIDKTNILAYDIQELRKNIGLVLQDGFLFSASIYENITLGNPAISRQQVIEATKLLGIHDFIMRLPDNYNYNIWERGTMLSIGQRQLLAFARVLVYNPCILILDEATASLDAQAERLIQEATAKLLQNRTCIIIAHRLSTIRYADKILVLDQGEIKEEGTHETLLAKQGYYAALYQAQHQVA